MEGTSPKEGVAPSTSMIPEGFDEGAFDVSETMSEGGAVINGPMETAGTISDSAGDPIFEQINAMFAPLNDWITEPWFPWVIVILVMWTLVWDGIALWYSARNNQLKWFIAILLLNTMGILEILYLKFWREEENAGEKYR